MKISQIQGEKDDKPKCPSEFVLYASPRQNWESYDKILWEKNRLKKNWPLEEKRESNSKSDNSVVFRVKGIENVVRILVRISSFDEKLRKNVLKCLQTNHTTGSFLQGKIVH